MYFSDVLPFLFLLISLFVSASAYNITCYRDIFTYEFFYLSALNNAIFLDYFFISLSLLPIFSSTPLSSFVYVSILYDCILRQNLGSDLGSLASSLHPALFFDEWQCLYWRTNKPFLKTFFLLGSKNNEGSFSSQAPTSACFLGIQ